MPLSLVSCACLAGALGAVPLDVDDPLRDLEQTVRHVQEKAAVYRDASRTLARWRHDAHRREVAAATEAFVHELEGGARAGRDAAIAQLQAFVQQHPHDAEHTPDAILRLGELLYERSYDAYTAARAAFDAAPQPPAGDEPALHYEPTIALMQQLIADFPEYRGVDGAYYLLGYCLGEQGEDERAAEAFVELTARRPQSRLAAEVWTRIGEYYFNDGQLDRAVLAYGHVGEHPDSPFYDKALYKLAWTHYRRADPVHAPQEFARSVDLFVQLLDLGEAARRAGHDRGGELRQEALDYIAICYAEERWGNLDKLRADFARRGGRPYERDVIVALADTYVEQARYADAIRAFHVALAAAPTAADAPAVHQRLVATLERQRDFARAAIEREAMAAAYADGGAWMRVNAADAPARATAERLTAQALRSGAQFFHRQAQADRQAGRLAVARAGYLRASHGYGAYLQRFPGDREAYALAYALADCLYYGSHYVPAALQYAAVRDANVDRSLQEDAALSVVLAYQDAVVAAEAAGTLAPLRTATAAQRREAPTPRPVPALYAAFIAGIDRYAELLPRSERLPRLLYRAAEVLYALDQLPQARARFAAVLARFPGDEVAHYASNLTIESFLAEHDYAAVAAFAATQLATLPMAASALRSELVSFRAGARFKIADALAAAGSHEAAAALYVALADEAPRAALADAALNNAAVALERAKRFDSAARTYERLVRDYPRSPLADTALFRVGLNAERFFDFPRAIAAYQQLETRYPQSASRPDAQYNAALALENTQAYERAAAAYQRYCTQFSKRSDAAAVCARSGAVLEKAGQYGRAVASYAHFVQAFRGDGAHRDRVIEAQLHIALAHAKLQQPRLALAAYRATVDAYRRGGSPAAAAAFAAEAEFNVADEARRAYESIALVGDSRKQKATLTRKAAELKRVEASYGAILKLKQVDWTLAALYRIGGLYQNFAETLVAAACPPDVKRAARRSGATVEEVCDEYRVLLEEKASAIEDKAVQAYETTVTRARELQVANAWTQQTLVALNKLRRAQWPLQKEAKQYLEAVAMLPPRLWGRAPGDGAASTVPADAATTP